MDKILDEVKALPYVVILFGAIAREINDGRIESMKQTFPPDYLGDLKAALALILQ